MRGRSAHAGRVAPVVRAHDGRPSTPSQVLAVARCLASACDSAPRGGAKSGRGVRGDRLGPSAAPAAPDAPTPAPGISRRDRRLDRRSGAPCLSLGRAGGGRLSAPGPSVSLGAGELRGRRPAAPGGGVAARPGRAPGYRAPGKLGGPRGLARDARNSGLGDLSPVSGGAPRPLRPLPAGAGGSARDLRRRTAAARPARPAARRDSGCPARPRAPRRLGGVPVLRTGVPRSAGAGAPGVGRPRADRSGLFEVSSGRDAGALRRRDRSGGFRWGDRLGGGGAGGHAAAVPGIGGVDP